MVRSATLVLAILMTAITTPAGCAPQVDAAPCAAELSHTVAVTVLAPSQRDDLARTATTTAVQLAEHAGLTATVRPAMDRSVTITTSTCMSTLVLGVSVGAPQAFVASATWYFEPVVTNATFVQPGGRVWRANRTETARWFGDDSLASYTPGPSWAAVSPGYERLRAEQAAARRGTAIAVQRVLSAIGAPSR